MIYWMKMALSRASLYLEFDFYDVKFYNDSKTICDPCSGANIF